MAESDAESVSSLDVKRWDAAQKALLAHGEVLMRDAQARDGPAFPPRAFNAMLVGCCGVRDERPRLPGHARGRKDTGATRLTRAKSQQRRAELRASQTCSNSNYLGSMLELGVSALKTTVAANRRQYLPCPQQ